MDKERRQQSQEGAYDNGLLFIVDHEAFLKGYEDITKESCTIKGWSWGTQ